MNKKWLVLLVFCHLASHNVQESESDYSQGLSYILFDTIEQAYLKIFWGSHMAISYSIQLPSMVNVILLLRLTVFSK